MAETGRRPAINPEDVLDVLEGSDKPFLSTSEIAAEVDASKPTVLKRLRTLQDDGAVRARQLEGGALIWYLPIVENRRLSEFLGGEGVDVEELRELVDTYGPGRIRKAATILEKSDEHGEPTEGDLEALETVATALAHGVDPEKIIKSIEADTQTAGREQQLAQTSFGAFLLGGLLATYGVVSLFVTALPGTQFALGFGAFAAVAAFLAFITAVIWWNLRRVGQSINIQGALGIESTDARSDT
jgi:DNA-binding Lrp family transcriptional regulator